MITIGTVFLLLLLIWGKIKRRQDLLFYYIKILVFFSLYLNIGYFLRIGSFDVTYSEILLFLCIVLGLPYLGNKYPKKTLSIMWVFLTTVFLGYFLLILNPTPPLVLPVGEGWDSYFYGRVKFVEAQFNFSHVIRFIRVALFFVFYFVFDRYVLSNFSRAQQIKTFIVNSAVFVAFAGIGEQIIKIFISPTFTFEFLNRIFGITGSQLTWYVERGGFPTLQGFMLEPGHFAQSFIPAILIVFLGKDINPKKKTKLFVLFSYVIFFSGSFAGVAIIALMLLMYLFGDKRKKYLKFGLTFSASLLILLAVYKTNASFFDYYLNRAVALLTNDNIGSSESVRSLSLNHAWELIKHYPLFGVGLGTTNVTGFIPSMLVNIGIIGSFLWFLIMRYGFSNSKFKNSKWMLLLMLAFVYMGDIGDVYSLSSMLIFSLVFREKTYKIEELEMAKQKELEVITTI